MSEEREYVDFTADIATWLSDVPSKSSSDNAQPIEERNASINDCSPSIRKRKRNLEPDRSPTESKRSRLLHSPARLALTEVNLNSFCGNFGHQVSQRRPLRSSTVTHTMYKLGLIDVFLVSDGCACHTRQAAERHES